ncbi:glycosyltransferase, partial [Desulfovibrio sp.]|uniref:glycosyltransferase n=1 Tax=Desulfovibrio sp. TaxID=885 RepID=UPI0023C4ADD1
IPCYRSEKTIGDVIAGIRKAMAEKADLYDYEIVCAIDGSPDKVSSVLNTLAAQDSRIKVVELSRNFGQGNAQMASLHYAGGDYCICLDDDGQCPIEHVWELFAPLRENADVSIAAYPHKEQSRFKNFGSRVNHIMVHLLLDVPSDFQVSNFFAFRAFIREQVLRYPNPYPYIPGLLAKATDNFAFVPMREHPRASGKTGYTFRKLVSLWMNGFTSFSVRPLRVASLLGCIFALLGFGFGLEAILRKIFLPGIQSGYTSIFAAILFIGGIIMCLLGLIGEYVGRIFICINRSPQFVVRRTVNVESDAAGAKPGQ